jgi:monoamine oxidase
LKTATPDVVIIGGGFAGVTAARELAIRGRTSVLVEARDRLGGRTHTVEHEGHAVELGGTWVHPSQPHVWAEITRYGLEVEELPVPGGRQGVWSQGQVRELSAEDLLQVLDVLGRVCAPAAELYPAPYSARGGPDPHGYRQRSARELLASLELPPTYRAALDAMCTTLASAPLERMAGSELMRVYALAGYKPVQLFAALAGTKLVAGTGALIRAIAADAKLTRLRLQSLVARVDQTERGVRVALASGEIVGGRCALVTLAMNTLNRVRFAPELSAEKRGAAEERHAGAGAKLYAVVKGDVGNVSLFAPESEVVNWVATCQHGAGRSLLVVFAASPEPFAGHDAAKIQAALRPLLPGIEVERVFGWDWAADPLALGTWCVFKPGQPDRVLPELRRTENRIFFASGDSAIGWRGFIDGAIESGYRSAHDIHRFLAKPATGGA